MQKHLLAFLGCLLWLGSAQAGLFDDDEARKQIAAVKVQVDAMEARLVKVEQITASQRLLDMHNQLEQLKSEISQLRGQLEVATHNLENAEKRQKDLYVDLDTRLRKLEPGGNLPSTPATTPGADTSATPAPVKLGDPALEGKTYDAAFALFRSGNYQGAINALNNFILSYPNSKLGPNAQYWIGASYSALKQHKQAITAQAKVVQNYPDSNKAPDALLNIASNMLELGDLAGARRAYEEVLKKYPISAAADIAKQRLAIMK